MHTAGQLFSNAYHLTRRNWLPVILEAIPILIVLIVSPFIVTQSILPLIAQFRSIIESSELDPAIITTMKPALIQAVYYSVPLLLVTGLLTVFLRSSLYAAVSHLAEGKSVTFGQSIHWGKRFFGIVLGMLITLIILNALVVLLGTLLQLSHQVLLGMVLKTGIGLLIGLAGLFAWPAIVLSGDSIARSFKRSFLLSIHHLGIIGLVYAIILLLHIAIFSLFGVAILVGVFLGPGAGFVAGGVALVLIIPVRTYMHAVYILLYREIVTAPGAYIPNGHS